MAESWRARRDIKMIIRLNPWERDMLERAAHLQGVMGGGFPPLACLVRTAAIAKAHAVIKRFNRRPKAERVQLEDEYELDCA